MFFILLICCLGAGNVKAGVIGPMCGSCEGGVYTLTYTNFQNIGVNDQVDISLTFDTTSYTGGGLYINAVAVKIAPSIVSATLTSTPLSAPSGSSWNTFDGGLNALGCSGAGSGFTCTESTGYGALVSVLSNTFTWRITIPTGTLFTGEGQASIKGLYTDAQGNKVENILSEGITLTPGGDDNQVPEPMTFVLMSAGLVGIAVLRRRH